MKDATLQKIFSSIGVLSIFIFTILSIGCTDASLDDAEKAEAEQNYAKAYQIYAKVVTERAESFIAPIAEDITSGKAFSDWISKVIAAYTSYLLKRPTTSDSVIAARKMHELETQLAFLENTIKLRKAGPISQQQLIDIFHELYFSEQKTLPPSALEAAKKLYRENYSVFSIKGDFASTMKGLLYNADRDIAIPFTLEWDSFQAQAILLPPGEWMALCIIVPEKSDPRNKAYFEAHNIIGRYAATYFTVPTTSQLLEYDFRHHGATY